MSLSKKKFLIDIIYEHKIGLSLAIFLMMVIGLIPCFTSQILGQLIAILSDQADLSFYTWFAYSLLWLIGGNMLWRLYDYVFLSVMSEVTSKSTYYYFNIIQRYNNLFFKKYSIGKINYNIMDISRAIDQLFSHFNERIVQEVMTIVFAVPLIFYYDIYLGCIMLVFLCSISLSAYIFSHYIKHLSFVFYEQRSYVSSLVSDILINIAHVKNLFQFRREREIVARQSILLAQKDRDMQHMMLYSHVVQSVISVITLSYCYWYLYQLKVIGILSISAIVALFYLLKEVIDSIWEVTESLADLFEEWGALEQVLKFIDDQYVCYLDKVKTNKFKDGDIEMNKVVFGYNGESNIFNSFSLSIKKGSRVGIVGISGVGKSTLASLFNRSYDVLSGDIKIGGQCLQEIDLQDLRRNIGIISQQLILFNRSIRDNICYGSELEYVSEQDIIDAAKNAGIHDFINKLPNKYDTVCTNNIFSGGQKQRILIARLLLIQCPILICDEHTSGLDNFTNQALKVTFDKVTEGKTVIYISHNLSLLKDTDRVVVLDNGKIIQDGKHEDLIKEVGVYKKLWNLK